MTLKLFCDIPSPNPKLHSNHDKRPDKPKLEDALLDIWSIFLWTVKDMKNEQKRTNCHRSESLGKGGQLNATWYFGMNPEQREDIKNL